MATAFSEELRGGLDWAVNYATDHDHEFVTLEHVLLSLVRTTSGGEIVTGCGGDPSALGAELEAFLDKNCPKMNFEEEDNPSREEWKPEVTLGFHRVIQRAVIQVHSADRQEVTVASLLISLFPESQSQAVYLLGQQGVNRFDVVNFVSHGITKESHALPGAGTREEGQGTEPEAEPAPSKGDPLESFTVNLNEKAKEGRIDPLIGREDILERVSQILCRRTKNNPLLVGEPGVGKTAIADGLALAIVEGRVPPKLKNAEIFSLDMGSLLAGTKYRGDFEQRLKGVVKALKKKVHGILFVDEMHTLVGAGATSGGSMDASNLLKPALADRSITVVGSTTHKEYNAYLDKDRAFSRRFQKVDLSEPTQEEAVKILEGLKSRYEEFHNIKYEPEVMQVAVDLSTKYVHGRPLPDKAIDVIDEAGARVQMKLKHGEAGKVSVEDIESVVASIAKVPTRSVSSDDKSLLQTLETELKKFIFGQDQAVESIVTAIKVARSGLRSGDKPIGCYLFAGPTGVGKTEVARQLAKHLGVELIRFDMSEYMEKHAVARLVGAPPGYVGYDEGGLLTDSVSKTPYAVLLLDEMEKAHPDIANVLLQVMDSGRLTDSTGRTVDFKNVIIIMTSNAGARELARKGIGIRPEGEQMRSLDAIKSMFAPEFINRLDSVVTFKGLGEDVLLQVVQKFVDEIEQQLADRKVNIQVSKEALKWLLNKGYDPAYGARQLGRTIDEHVKKPMVDELLFGSLSSGGTVKVGVKDGELSFSYS